MSADALITRSGPVAAPLDYVVPAGGSMQPLCVSALLDGSGAAVPWIALLEVIAPTGAVVAYCPIPVTIAAGGSAICSWFPWWRGIATIVTPPPSPLGTLWAWYDFADTTTITLDGSSKIVSIRDKSGNGHDAGQSIAAQRPSESTLNGLNCGLFSSAAKTILASTGWSPTLPQPFTIVVVWTQTIASSANYQPGPFGAGPSPPPPILFDNFNNTGLFMQQGSNSISKAVSAPYTQQQATLIYNGASSVFRLNGAASTGSVDVDTMTNVALGTSHSPSDPTIVQEMDGKLGELLIYAGALTAAQIAGVESYLKAKWATP